MFGYCDSKLSPLLSDMNSLLFKCYRAGFQPRHCWLWAGFIVGKEWSFLHIIGYCEASLSSLHHMPSHTPPVVTVKNLSRVGQLSFGEQNHYWLRIIMLECNLRQKKNWIKPTEDTNVEPAITKLVKYLFLESFIRHHLEIIKWWSIYIWNDTP